MNSDQILYACEHERSFLKLTGSVRYPLSRRLKQAIQTLFSNSAVRTIMVDLQEVSYIDSTCLGLLARIVNLCADNKCERPIIVSTNLDINAVLSSMGFDQVFVLIDDPIQPIARLSDASELADFSRRPDPQTVLDAHKTLCELNSRNKALFQNVIEQLEQDIETEDAGRSND